MLKLGLSLKPRDYKKLVCEWPQVWDRKKKKDGGGGGRVGLPSFATRLTVGVL